MNRPNESIEALNELEDFELYDYIMFVEKENKQLKEDYEVQKQYFAGVLNETKQDLEKARDTLVKERNLITKLYKEIEGLVDGTR